LNSEHRDRKIARSTTPYLIEFLRGGDHLGRSIVPRLVSTPRMGHAENPSACPPSKHVDTGSTPDEAASRMRHASRRFEIRLKSM